MLPPPPRLLQHMSAAPRVIARNNWGITLWRIEFQHIQQIAHGFFPQQVVSDICHSNYMHDRSI